MIWISKPCLQLEDASTPKQQIVVSLAIVDGTLLGRYSYRYGKTLRSSYCKQLRRLKSHG